MKQGEIWQINLDPTTDSEQSGYRPFVILSGNLLNEYSNVIFGCPLTSKIKNLRGNLVLEPTKANGLIITSEVLVFHIRSVSKSRFSRHLGAISNDQIKVLQISLNKLIDY